MKVLVPTIRSSIILCLLLLYPSYAFAQTKTNLAKTNLIPHSFLTIQERQWIKTHPMIHACVENDWAPFSYVDANGDITGLSKDYLDTLANISGLTVKYHYNLTWEEILKKTKNDECDVLNGLYYTKQRSQYIHFTMPYLTLNEYFFTRQKTKTIYHMKELEDKTIALVKGYATSNWIKKNYPHVHIVEKDSIAECLYSVLSKESDVFIGDNPSTLYNLEQNLITGIKINNTYSEVKPRKILMGVKNSYPLLASILTKSILSMDEVQEKELRLKWMNISNKQTISLSKKEKLWLQTNPEITYTFDPNWKPFEWKNNLQQHVGVYCDIMGHLEKRSGLQFIAKPSSDWSSAIDKVKSGEVSIISGIGVTEERKKHLHFSSKSLFLLPYVFVVHKTNHNKDNFNSIRNKRITVLKDSTIASILTKKYPYLRPHFVSTVQEGFEHLEKYKSDLFIVNNASAKYYIDVLRHETLKISYQTSHLLDLKLAFYKNIAPEAMTIINKVLQTFDKQELDNILHKWTQSTIQKEINWKIFTYVLIGSLLIVLLFMLLNRRLSSLIKEKNRELQDINNRLENTVKERTSELLKLNKKLSYAAHIDPMTKIYNRRYFFNVSSDIINAHKIKEIHLTIAMVDIDLFKKINDTYGHDIGDRVILNIVNSIKTCIRQDDTLVRFGGEEFLILFQNTSVSNAYLICERIRNFIENNHPLEHINPTVSIGVASYGNLDTNINDVIKKSDMALYNAKESGRNKVMTY